MTNVKAGDLAIVKSNKPQYNGRIVEVLYAAPKEGFYLPNRQWHLPVDCHPSWVIKAIGLPLKAPYSNGTWREVWYGVGADSSLRPLPGELDETLIEQESTVK